MKNYHFSWNIFFTVFKWITIDLTYKPKYTGAYLKFSFDYQRKCSLPGVYINFNFLNLFNLWVSVFDERILTNGILTDPRLVKSVKFTPEQVKDMDGLLGDWTYLSPRFDQAFRKYDNLPYSIAEYREEFNDFSRTMEHRLRTDINANQ